jgi:hypothetical protein
MARTEVVIRGGSCRDFSRHAGRLFVYRCGKRAVCNRIWTSPCRGFRIMAATTKGGFQKDK